MAAQQTGDTAILAHWWREIELMHGIAPGFASTRAAWHAMTAPADAAHRH